MKSLDDAKARPHSVHATVPAIARHPHLEADIGAGFGPDTTDDTTETRKA
jgi:hypothetical protein